MRSLDWNLDAVREGTSQHDSDAVSDLVSRSHPRLPAYDTRTFVAHEDTRSQARCPW